MATRLRTLDRALPAESARVTSAADDEAVHDLRVTIRRIRTVLRLVRPLYGRFHADVVRRAFASVQRATGALRDEEALVETLDGLELPATAELTRFRTARRRREIALRRAVVAHLRSGELARARRLLDALLTLPVRPKRERELAGFAERVVARARKGVQRKRDADPDDARALHDLRIAYKHLRYAIETFGEALAGAEGGAAAAAEREQAKAEQKRLGEVHDLDVALAVIARTRSLGPAAREGLKRALREARARKVGR